jgi:two-component system KDP operon response regulator KdpE
MKECRILLVDDEERILSVLRIKLNALGYHVITASSGAQALEQAQAQRPDIIVLDIVMPGMDGFQTLRELRAFTDCPVIILSAKDSDRDKIKGLDLGADDYLAKPFNPDELVARVKALGRRIASVDAGKSLNHFSVEGLVIDFQKRVVTKNGESVRLMRIEWLLLAELARNSGHLLTYEELLSRVWGPEYRNDIGILRTWISRLRNKLENEPKVPRLIRTVAKTGYIMSSPNS